MRQWDQVKKTFIVRVKDVSWGKRVGIPVHLQVIQPRGSFLHTLVLFAYLLIHCDVDITAISIFETGVKN